MSNHPHITALENLLAKIVGPGKIEEGQRRGVRRSINEMKKVVQAEDQYTVQEFNDARDDDVLATLRSDGTVTVTGPGFESKRLNSADDLDQAAFEINRAEETTHG